MILTGIGSRETPASILSLMSQIGSWCREKKVFLRSGHATGADWAFEQGAQEVCVAYLPWAGYNSALKSNANFHVVAPTLALHKMVDIYHPAPARLSPGARKLMCRNVPQVLGITGASISNAVICWTKDGSFSGGTGMALRLAKHRNIPIFNLFYSENQNFQNLTNRLSRFISLKGAPHE